MRSSAPDRETSSGAGTKSRFWRPTREQILAASGKTVPDVIAPGLSVLFCGINPGLYSAAVGHHFARPGNRFWPTLHGAGFTKSILSPFAERELLGGGFGITNIAARATVNAAELTNQELIEGGRTLIDKVRRYRPRFLAILGIGAFRSAFARREGRLGRQEEAIDGTVVWVLPSTSGLNAHYAEADLVRLFRELRMALEGNP